MTDQDDRERTENARPARKPYAKPAIIWEEVLDVRTSLAVACGKTAGRGGICNAAPTS